MTARRLVLALFATVSAILLVSAPALAISQGFTAKLSGGVETPPVTTSATGTATFVLSPDGQSLKYIVEVTGISDVTAAHIHLAPIGTPGPVVVGLFAGPAKAGPFTGVLAEGTITAAELRGLLLGKPIDALLMEIKAGNTYVNVHTMAHPGGEIRGQISLIPMMP